MPLLPSGNSVFDISRAYTCCCRGFEATSVSPADQSGLWKEQYSLRDFVSGSHFSGGLNEEFKKASVSLLLGRFITQTADSLHGIFFFFLYMQP